MKSQLAIHVEMVRTMARTTSNAFARMLLSRRAWNARRAIYITIKTTMQKRTFRKGRKACRMTCRGGKKTHHRSRRGGATWPTGVIHFPVISFPRDFISP